MGKFEADIDFIILHCHKLGKPIPLGLIAMVKGHPCDDVCNDTHSLATGQQKDQRWKYINLTTLLCKQELLHHDQTRHEYDISGSKYELIL